MSYNYLQEENYEYVSGLSSKKSNNNPPKSTQEAPTTSIGLPATISSGEEVKGMDTSSAREISELNQMIYSKSNLNLTGPGNCRSIYPESQIPIATDMTEDRKAREEAEQDIDQLRREQRRRDQQD